MISKRETVSVIVPMFNCASYVTGCVESILAQSMPPCEILLVDDGSADKSAEIGKSLERRYRQVRLLRHGENLGAGAARNTGLSAAAGEYVLFLDADDLYEETLLERAVTAAETDGADVVLYGADHYLGKPRRFAPAPEMLQESLLPEKRPFQAEDAPDTLFQICTPEVWNKLFRRSFVQEKGLSFQELPNANDLCFSLSAMALGKITVVPDVLIHYRVNAGGVQSGKSRAPHAFRDALEALREELRVRGRWELLERSFVNLALFHINYNYRGMRAELQEDLRTLYGEFGIAGKPRSYFLSSHEYELYAGNIAGLPDFDAFGEEGHTDLFRTLADSAVRQGEERLRQAEETEKAAREEIERIRDSVSYRVGKAVTAVPRAIRDIMQKEKL